MLNTESKCAGTTDLSSAMSSMFIREPSLPLPMIMESPPCMGVAMPISSRIADRHDPDGRLIDALIDKLPPGSDLLEAWQGGPASLYAFLSALWAAEVAGEPEVGAGQVRLDCGNKRLKVLADLDNDDVPLEQPAYES